MPGVLLTLTAADWEARRARRTDRRASDAVQRRPADERCAAPGLRPRQGVSCRRHRRGGGRRDAALPRRKRPRPSRSITNRCPRCASRARRSPPARRWCMSGSAPTWSSRSSAATATRPRRPWPAPPRSSNCSCATAGSRPIRWSRAPIYATTTPRPTATRSTPRASSRTICAAGFRSTRCTFPSTKSASISPDVGGGFGVKGHFRRSKCRRRVGRANPAPAGANGPRPAPKRSSPTRRRAITTRTPAWAFDSDGRIVAMQVDTLAALGGYLSNFAPSIPGNSYPQTITGLYRTPNLHLRVRGVYTNTVPIDAYRGSGRPEATWINERLIERGARELGIDVGRDAPAQSDRRARTSPIRRRAAASTIPATRRRCWTSCCRWRITRRCGASRRSLRQRGILMGIGLAVLHRQGGDRPERQSRQARRSAWRLGKRDRARTQRRQGDGVRRQPLARPGPRHHLLPDRRRPARARRSTISVWSKATPTGFRSATAPGVRAPTSVAGTAIFRAADKVIAKARRFAAEVLECASGRHRISARAISRARHRSRNRLRGGRRRRLSRRGAARGRLARSGPRSHRIL